MIKKRFVLGMMLCIGAQFIQYAFAQQLPALSSSLYVLKPENVLPFNAQKNYTFADNSKPGSPSSFLIKPGTDNTPVFVTEVLASLPSHYNVQTTWKSILPVKKGDVLLARFAMRAIYARQESGDAVVNFFVQTQAPGYEKSTITQVGANTSWKVFNIPFVAVADMPAGDASICFSFGALPQKVEISQLEVLNFGTKATLSQLPVTRFTYRGRELNAPWRTAALKRIERIRTAPLTIQVVDAKGKPVKGVKVNARMVQSEFLFGTAVSAGLLCKESPDKEKYTHTLKELFNTVTIENGLKWGAWVNADSRECTKQAVKWINQEGFRLRGHNLVWPSKKFSPQSYRSKPDYGPGFTDSITNHIKEIVAFTKGKVVAWDVINEMIHENDYFNVMPRTVAADWFKLAKQIDPNAQLFINEYGMLNSPSSAKMVQSYLDLIAELKSYGAPIDAIGVQGHIGKQPSDPTEVLADLDRLAKAGLPIQITEFDINTPDEQIQADYTRDFLIACYSHPSITGFTMWGFWEPNHWKPDAAMFRKDWSEKPNAAVWREWVTKKWNTNITQATQADGAVHVRGHLGRYQITVTKNNGSTTKVSYQLTGKSGPIKVKI